jgi:high-affinity iron transporter
MKMVLIGAKALLLAASLLQIPQQATLSNDLAPAVRRLAAMADLAAQEYRVGIVNGRIASQAEVDEARLFLTESRRSATILPEGIRVELIRSLDSLIRLVATTAPPDTIDARVLRLTTSVSRRLGVNLDEIPSKAPVLARGAQVYQANCASCHGETGRGDGILGHGLDPKPADLTNAAALADQSPLDYYRRITMGVVGTAMPGFELHLPAEDRWAVALYASLLRLPPPSGDVPPELQAFSKTGRMSDAELLRALGAQEPSSAGLARVAAVRSVQPDASAGAIARVFAEVRAQLESTYALARTGDSSAGTKALDAYMTFEQVEHGLRAKNSRLAAELEASFAALRGVTTAGVSRPNLDEIRKQLALDLERAERVLGDDPSPQNVFLQSVVILVREGLEAILIVGTLLTFLVKMGAPHRKRDIHIGVAAAVGASLGTAFALETVFHVTPAKQEALEGVTMMLATAMLFYVSYWLLSKMEVIKWNQFVKSKVHSAVTSGSSLALASAAFLAVYREGFETVLFYKALFLAGGSGSSGIPILLGMLGGSLVLVGVYVAMSRFGVRLPLKPFFAVTSVLLYYMAFVFAGKGMAELQGSGLIPTTMIERAPRVPTLGIYPTVESLVVQGVLLVLLLVAVVWTFGIRPRRRRLRFTRVATMLPRPTPELATALDDERNTAE